MSPERQAALAARLNYYRDLGIFDFYRRATGANHEPLSIEGEAASPVPAVPAPLPIATTEAVFSPPPEEIPIARKPSATLPLIVDTPDYSSIAGKGAPALVEIREELGDCTRCKLSRTRNKIVFGDGDPQARLLFVGEGPGADEDAKGLPFVGRGGQLLNNMIHAMGLKREQVYIANIVKCRPPQNRVPEPDEAHTCFPFLERQIAAVQPEVIVALGSTAASYLLDVKKPLSALRGRIHASRGAKLIVTYHPAFLLRDPRQKKEAWADLQIAMAELGLRPAKAPSA